MKTVLVVAAHPDDEILGLGGTVRKLSDEGVAVHCVILAEGMTSRETDASDYVADLKRLQTDSRSSAERVGFSSIEFVGLPDNRMDQLDLLTVIQVVEERIQSIQPDTVFTHSNTDLNIDHQMTFQAVLTAVRPMAGGSVKELHCFETPSSTEWSFGRVHGAFSPNYFVDVTLTLEHKLDAMACYETELRQPPHPRALESLKAIAARWGSVVGVSYAEAFETIFRIA